MSGTKRQSFAYLILLVLPVKPHPLPSRCDEWFLSDGEQTIEADTERSDLFFVWISFSWIKTLAAQQPGAGPLRTNLLQAIPIFIPE